MAIHRLSTNAILGAALVCLLAPAARAQDRMPPIPKDKMTAEQQKVVARREPEPPQPGAHRDSDSHLRTGMDAAF
jgi:hypothetical protein